MAVTDSMSVHFAADLFRGVHTVDDEYRLVLGGADAIVGDYDHTAQTYVAGMGGDELPSGGGYTQGGIPLSGAAVSVDDTVALFDFADPSIEEFTGTFRMILIYNATRANRVLGVWNARDSGGRLVPITGTGGRLDIALPRAGAGVFAIAVG